jgi:hypothetical protein
MHNNMKVYGEVQISVWLHAFLISGMDKMNYQLYAPTVLIPDKAKLKIIMSRSSISNCKAKCGLKSMFVSRSP